MRAYTSDEARDIFLANIKSIVNYWAHLSDKDVEEKCDGVAFSILTLMDGEHLDMPSVDISLAPHPEDKDYHLGEGENYFEYGMIINEYPLHEAYYMMDRKDDEWTIFQCKLTNNGTVDYAYIEERGAKIGNQVEIPKGSGIFGLWSLFMVLVQNQRSSLTNRSFGQKITFRAQKTVDVQKTINYVESINNGIPQHGGKDHVAKILVFKDS